MIIISHLSYCKRAFMLHICVSLPVFWMVFFSKLKPLQITFTLQKKCKIRKYTEYDLLWQIHISFWTFRHFLTSFPFPCCFFQDTSMEIDPTKALPLGNKTLQTESWIVQSVSYMKIRTRELTLRSFTLQVLK